MGALEDWREAAAMPRGVEPGGSALPWTVGRLVRIDEAANRAVVSIQGSQPVALPYVPNAYEGITTVYVQLDPLRSGAGQKVLGPCGVVPEAEEPVVIALPPVPPPPPAVVTATTWISPTATGTWSTKWGRFAAWQPERYGGPSTMYQGNAYGSGVLIGQAAYGDQIVGLGATSIVSMTVESYPITGGGTPAFCAAAQGALSGAPSGLGPTFAGTGSVPVDPAAAELLRTGAAKSIAMVGAEYVAIYGRNNVNGMVLTVTYTRPG